MQEVVLPLDSVQIRVSVGGFAIPGLAEFAIRQVGYFSASRFQASFAISVSENSSIGYFLALSGQQVMIEIAAGLSGYNTLIIGLVELIEIDLSTNLATLAGRDLTAALIDTEISTTYENQTASEIVQTIAERHQLTPAISETPGLVGQYYELDYVKTILSAQTRGGTEWNLLIALAQLQDAYVWISGTTLHFGNFKPEAVENFDIGNFSSLKFDNINGQPTGVTVRSWNSKEKVVVNSTAGNGIMSTIVRPNLTQFQADKVSQSHLNFIQQHGTIMTATMPIETTLMPGININFSGTETSLDQTYIVSSVIRSLTGNGKLIQNIRAFAATVD